MLLRWRLLASIRHGAVLRVVVLMILVMRVTVTVVLLRGGHRWTNATGRRWIRIGLVRHCGRGRLLGLVLLRQMVRSATHNGGGGAGRRRAPWPSSASIRQRRAAAGWRVARAAAGTVAVATASRVDVALLWLVLRERLRCGRVTRRTKLLLWSLLLMLVLVRGGCRMLLLLLLLVM